MAVVEQRPKRERLQHVALDVDVTLQIGLGDVSLVQRAQRLYRALVVQVDAELWLPLTHSPLGAVRQRDGEGRRDLADTIDESVERACS